MTQFNDAAVDLAEPEEAGNLNDTADASDAEDEEDAASAAAEDVGFYRNIVDDLIDDENGANAPVEQDGDDVGTAGDMLSRVNDVTTTQPEVHLQLSTPSRLSPRLSGQKTRPSGSEVYKALYRKRQSLFVQMHDILSELNRTESEMRRTCGEGESAARQTLIFTPDAQIAVAERTCRISVNPPDRKRRKNAKFSLQGSANSQDIIKRMSEANRKREEKEHNKRQRSLHTLKKRPAFQMFIQDEGVQPGDAAAELAAADRFAALDKAAKQELADRADANRPRKKRRPAEADDSTGQQDATPVDDPKLPKMMAKNPAFKMYVAEQTGGWELDDPDQYAPFVREFNHKSDEDRAKLAARWAFNPLNPDAQRLLQRRLREKRFQAYCSEEGANMENLSLDKQLQLLESYEQKKHAPTQPLQQPSRSSGRERKPNHKPDF